MNTEKEQELFFFLFSLSIKYISFCKIAITYLKYPGKEQDG